MVQVSRVTERAKTSSETRTSDIASGQPRRRCLFLILETPTIKNKGTFMIRVSVSSFFDEGRRLHIAVALCLLQPFEIDLKFLNRDE